MAKIKVQSDSSTKRTSEQKSLQFWATGLLQRLLLFFIENQTKAKAKINNCH